MLCSIAFIEVYPKALDSIFPVGYGSGLWTLSYGEKGFVSGGGEARDLVSGGTGSDSLYGGDWLVGSAEGGTLVRTGRTSSSSRAASTPARIGEHLHGALPDRGQ